MAALHITLPPDTENVFIFLMEEIQKQVDGKSLRQDLQPTVPGTNLDTLGAISL